METVVVLPCIFLQDQVNPSFISLDANFRLCRRKKAGRAVTDVKPLFSDEVFADQAAVDNYVQASKTVVPMTENPSDTVSLD